MTTLIGAGAPTPKADRATQHAATLNPDGVSVKGCTTIYPPKGQAGEYSALATNLYRGCGHGCAYCLAPDTLIQMADGTTRMICDVQIGDDLIGIEKADVQRRAWNYTFAVSRVLNKITTRKPAIRVTTADGQTVVCSDDHRWLTERGWKHTRNLTLNNVIRTFSAPAVATPGETDDYRRGYLAGIIRGDGTLGRYDYSGRYQRAGRKAPQRTDVQHAFRLAMKDESALDRAAAFLRLFGIETTRFAFQHEGAGRPTIPAIRANGVAAYAAISAVTQDGHTLEWRRGFLAGIFDAEGGCDGTVIRVFNTDEALLSLIETCFATFDFKTTRDNRAPKVGCPSIRVTGGREEVARFFNLTAPAISRKFDVVGGALRGSSRIVAIEPTGETIDMVDITTSTENFIANGLVSHNCYVPHVTKQPRPEFDAGASLRPGILSKLVRDAAKYAAIGSSTQIMFSFTTDPYHPFDSDPTRAALHVLRQCGLPFCTLTKGGTRALRDLDLFRPEMDAFASTLTTLDDAFSKKWERGAALPGDRLAALRRFHDAGIFTWVSLEPTLDIEASLGIVEATHEFVDLYKVGRANYLKEITRTTDWEGYTHRMIQSLAHRRVACYIKHDLQPFLPAGFPNPLRVQQNKSAAAVAELRDLADRQAAVVLG